VHDDRRLVEDRISRYLDRRFRPAHHTARAARAALTVKAWHVPGEPVAVADALRVPKAHALNLPLRPAGGSSAEPGRNAGPESVRSAGSESGWSTGPESGRSTDPESADGALDLALRPFQILTLRLTPGTVDD
jgi:hypothetical protein